MEQLKTPITHRLTAEHYAQLATASLIQEVRVTPKPGLVDLRGGGVHQDLTLELMELSANTLEDTFYKIACVADTHIHVNSVLREQIGLLGRLGEQQMLIATGDVNTHRGAIWAFGLLIAVLNLKVSPLTLGQLLEKAAQLARMQDRSLVVHALSNGSKVKFKYGISGAREQAQRGFPQMLSGLKQLHLSRARGHSESIAQVDALLAIISQLSDTCVAHRAGPQGLTWLQQQAGEVLAAGGYGTERGAGHYQVLEQGALAKNISPGGAADLLAVCLFIDELIKQEVITWKF